MKQISSFMSEIGDEFKIVVVKAIRELCLKYPKKHRVMVGFLATFLREEGASACTFAQLFFFRSFWS
jgi:coatomer protein complex subunit gamma